MSAMAGLTPNAHAYFVMENCTLRDRASVSVVFDLKSRILQASMATCALVQQWTLTSLM